MLATLQLQDIASKNIFGYGNDILPSFMAHKRSRTYHFCIPEKVMAFFPDIGIPSIKGFSLDRMKYIISMIVTHKQDNHPGAYSVLNMKYLRNIVPYAERYLDLLRDYGIVEWKNHSAGRNSRMYRITKLYDGKIIYRTVTDQRLVHRIEQHVDKLKLRNSKKYPDLNKYVYAVEIDVTAAFATIEKTYHENLTSDDPETRHKADARRTFSIGEIEKIRTRQIYIRVNGTNNRYDTNYTRLPGELIQHLSINGKPLYELDIRNSQPFFVVGLFDPSPEIQRIIGISLTMLVKSLQLFDKLDVKLYRLLVCNGNFYDFMMEKFMENKILFADRADFKEQLFTVFFGKNNAIHYSPAVKLFEMLFPNVYELFTMIKKREHNRLAILLTRIEAFVMLDRIAPKIINDFRELEFITKHDSLLPAGIFVTGDVDEIIPLMKSEIKNVVGGEPKICVKNSRAASNHPISSFISSKHQILNHKYQYPFHYVGQNLVIN